MYTSGGQFGLSLGSAMQSEESKNHFWDPYLLPGDLLGVFERQERCRQGNRRDINDM